MTAAGGRSSTLLATTVSPEGAVPGPGAALATNLQVKGLATGRRISCRSSRRDQWESRGALSKFVRGHCIEFLKNRCLVLKCVAMRGVLMKNGMFLDWTMLKACLKDQ